MRLPFTDRYGRLATSIFASVGGQFVSLVAPLVLMPAMLAYLGDIAFGIWASSVAITGVTAFLDLGIGSGLLSRLSQAFGLRDHAAVRRYVASAYGVLGSICLAGLAMLTLATVLGADAYFSDPNAWPIVLVVLVSFFVGMPAVVIYRILQSALRIPLQSGLQIVGALTAILACLAAIHLQAPPWIVVAAYSATPVAVMVLASIWFFIGNPMDRPSISDFSVSQMRQLLGFGSFFFILSILTAIGNNADLPIVAHVAGPEVVASLVPPLRLGSVMALLISQLFMPLWSFNGEALARGDVSWVRRTTLLMSVGGAMLVLVCGLAITALSEPLMMLWMGRTFENQDLVLFGMTAASAVIAFTSPYNMVLNAKGMAQQQILPWVGFVVLSLGLKFWLLTATNAWMAPAITAACYVAIVTPAIVYHARKALLSAREAADTPSRD